MTINNPRAAVAHRRNIGRLMNAGQDLARTAEKTHEMALASVQTIGYRTAMMMQAFGDPVAMTNPEFALMGREKMEAAVESHQAIVSSFQRLMEGLFSWAAGQHHDNTRTVVELATCRNPAQFLTIQQRYIHGTCINAANAAARFTEAAIRLTGAGLIPVHKVASANAKRLARENG
jgi:hypothetical protein